MGQIPSRYMLNEDNTAMKKTLPHDFSANTSDEISFKKALAISTALHPAAAVTVWIISIALAFLGINLFMFEKPNLLPKKDIEFVLVNKKEAPPINKNTNLRSDRNSRAGGIHDPKRKISEPSPTPAKQAKSIKPSPAPKPAVKAAAKPAPNANLMKKIEQAAPAPKTPAKPKPMQAPKPAAPLVKQAGPDMPKAQMPRIVQTPSSPFTTTVPRGTQPTGTTISQGGGGATSGGYKPQGTGVGAGSGSHGLSPQFSKGTGVGTRGTTGTGTTGSRGSSGGGYGNYGNPSPGNPAGAPGIDAIRQADWGPYMRNLEARIRRNWNPPKGDTSKRVVIYFKISRDGKLLSMNVVKSSGLALADQAARAWSSGSAVVIYSSKGWMLRFSCRSSILSSRSVSGLSTSSSITNLSHEASETKATVATRYIIQRLIALMLCKGSI